MSNEVQARVFGSEFTASQVKALLEIAANKPGSWTPMAIADRFKRVVEAIRSVPDE